MLGFALVINSSILILAGASFFYNPDATGEADIGGAFELIKQFIGNGAGIVFALALLCAGQSASITATLAGQVVSEGFINWRTPPTIRRIVTRLIGVIPAAAVAAAVGSSGLNTMLVASQVVLSIILPTVIFPLVLLCSKDDLMTVEGPVITDEAGTVASTSADNMPRENEQARRRQVGDADADVDAITSVTVAAAPSDSPITITTQPPRKTKSYRSPLWITILGYILFVVVVVANAYVIVQLCLGNG